MLRKKKLTPTTPEPVVAKVAVPATPAVLSKTVMRFANTLVTSVRKDVKDADFQLVSSGAVMSDVSEWIPTGFHGIDYIFGGGWPVGRCSEVAGPEGCGKSALAQMACIQTQKLGGLVVYLDFEHALDMAKMTKLGINPDGLLYLSPDYIEQAWDVVWSIVDRLQVEHPTAPTLFVWDSVGGSLTKSQYESSAEDSFVGPVPRVMNPNCAKLFKKIARCRAHFMFINQERADIGKFSRFGPPPKKTAGGDGLRYAASLRVRCARVVTLKSNGVKGQASGYLIKTTTDKNRLTPPHRKATWVLDFEVGPSPDLTLFETLKDAGKIVALSDPKNPGLYKLRGYDGAPFNRSGWSERLGADDVLHNHTMATYMALIREGFSPVKGASSDSES